MPAVRQFDVLGKRIPERSDILSEYQREPLFLLLADIGIGIRSSPSIRRQEKIQPICRLQSAEGDPEEPESVPLFYLHS